MWLAVSLLTATLIAGLILRANPVASQSDQATGSKSQFTGQVLSAGTLVVGGVAATLGHPVAGAMVHLVPVAAMDITTRMTASAIYAPPYPAEVYDEPLEDAIRLRGAGFPQATTDSRGDFVIANVPNGKFFIHVTPSSKDTAHLPGGDQSRRSFSADQLRGRSMTVRLSSNPSAAARYTGSSTYLTCHKDKTHWQQTAHKLGLDCAGSAWSDAGFFETPPYTNAQEEENNAYWEGPLKSHVFDVPLKTSVAVDGVPPGRAMPIPYTAACGTCHLVNELPFK